MDRPHIETDLELVDDVATRLDLRIPNREALLVIAERFGAEGGKPFEGIIDSATGVGKTYIAAGVIEYLATQGVRNFVIVTPGTTIYNKTIANFTPEHPKSVLGGMAVKPMVVTAENFNTGEVRAALDNENVTKLFIFRVQQLLRPTDKMTRRTRKFQEWLGRDLYEHLTAQPDLVVIGDEHHLYQENAKAFSRAVNDLSPLAVLGLTATPTTEQEANVIYHYPLARAIAERYVKVPVLVGRSDDRIDIETRLRDGLVLLEAKSVAATGFVAATTGNPQVNPVMFVVATTIDQADAIAEVLGRILGEEAKDKVLTVHSDAKDREAMLEALAQVEEPDSPVRVIVSVGMLKEGWDVKNIFVIASFRPSIADALTEQTLGRGLRLPWGAYTGIELLDTVEVLSHERYKTLLRDAGVLIEGLVPKRTETLTTAATGLPTTTVTPTDVAVGGDTISTPSPGGLFDTSTTGAAPVIGTAEIGERISQAKAEAQATTQPVVARSDIAVELPYVTVRHGKRSFALSDIEPATFEDIGKQFAATPAETFHRTLADVEDDPDRPGKLRVIRRKAQDVITAATPVNLPLGEVRETILDSILGNDLVEVNAANETGADLLITEFIKGVGGDDTAEKLLPQYLTSVCQTITAAIRASYTSQEVTVINKVTVLPFAPTRVGRKATEDRFGKFERGQGYAGWEKSLMPIEWFDSGSAERDLANLLDGAAEVEVWVKLHINDYVIVYAGGNYQPDFYVRLTDGTHWLLEGKADNKLDDETVLAKKKAAEKLARFLTHSGETEGTWRYGVVGETAIANAKGSWPVLLAQAGLTA